jgi:TPR repeat protein
VNARASVVLAIAWAIVVATAHVAAAGPPSGYRCGADGAPLRGKGCQCGKDKVDARDADDNAICVRQAKPVRPRPPAAPVDRTAEQDARCRAGNAAACTLAARGYARNDSASHDPGKAQALYRRACDGGDAEGCAELGAVYEAIHEDTTAQGLYQQSCLAGHARGCASLGALYAAGRGSARDDAKAVAMFRKACDANDPGGCLQLGAMYEAGRGAVRDDAHAVTF